MKTDRFYALKLDELFEIIELGSSGEHHHKFKIRCKACGQEHWHDDAVLRKQVNYIRCPFCKNSNFVSKAKPYVKKDEPEYVQKIVDMYSAGIEQKEITEATGRSYHTVGYWLKKKGLYDLNRRVHNTEAAHIANHKIQKQEDQPGTHIQRAIRYGCQWEYGVTLKKLLKRDGLRCAICGEQCDVNDKSYGNGTGPLYPSMDHIIPIAKGGSHTWNNVQVAHVICNTLKKDKIGLTIGGIHP